MNNEDICMSCFERTHCNVYSRIIADICKYREEWEMTVTLSVKICPYFNAKEKQKC